MRPAGSRRSPAGFTLTELVISIGLILLLAGLGLSVSVAVIEQSERRQTQTVLTLLDTAVKEWELTAERKLSWWNWGDDPGTADVRADTEEVLIITEILDVISRSEQVKRIIAGIDPELVYTYRPDTYPSWNDTPQERVQQDDLPGGALTILDAWGTPIYATHPGRPWTTADQAKYLPRDSDGTIRTRNERRYGIAPNRRVVFVSAGPDRRFGLDVEVQHLPIDERQEARRTARVDNIYSADVGIPDDY